MWYLQPRPGASGNSQKGARNLPRLVLKSGYGPPGMSPCAVADLSIPLVLSRQKRDHPKTQPGRWTQTWTMDSNLDDEKQKPVATFKSRTERWPL